MKFSDFGFKENPFSITPDPRYLYLSQGHEESLAHLIYGTGPNGGFVLLTGEVGTGKTLLIRSLLAQQLTDVDIALVLNPRLSRREFLSTVIEELGIDYKGHPYSLKQLMSALSEHLLKTHGEGRHTVLIVDEAQNLSPRVLEQVRLLTNLETTRHKLLRIILVGQPELLEMLGREELRQVDQRITARYHLYPLNRQETSRYITHRLAVAGIREDLFSPLAMRLVHRFSRGVPRKINTICERTLLAVFSRGQNRVGAKLVWQASKEVKGVRRSGRRLWPWFAIGMVVVIALIYFSLPFLFETEKVSLEIVSALEGKDEIEKIVEPAAIQPVVAKPKMTAGSPTEIISEPEPEPKPKPETRAEKVAPGPEVEKAPVTPVVTSPEIESTETADNVEVEMGSEEPPAEDYSLAALFAQSQNRQLVYQRLFSLWQQTVNLNSPMTPCMQAPQKGLRCLRDILDWDRLHSLNRPFIFRLRRDKQTRMLLLKRLDGDRLLVDDGVGEAFLKLDEIQPYWSGEFVMLWRPYDGVALIGDGSAGDAVTWLRNRLHLVDGEPVKSKPGLDQFDEALKTRLRSFQQSNGLMADGIAGQQTMVYLNNLSLTLETPTLYTLEERGGG